MNKLRLPDDFLTALLGANRSAGPNFADSLRQAVRKLPGKRDAHVRKERRDLFAVISTGPPAPLGPCNWTLDPV